MKVFSASHTAPILLSSDACEAIVLAARDLQRDLRRLSGSCAGFDFVSDRADNCIQIQTVPGGQAESYCVCVEPHRILITGADTLGTVFGIYAFSTRCLNILPMHAFMDLFPAVRPCLDIPEQQFVSPGRKVRFRGWFLNDEDLLSQLKPGGKRNIDYPFYGDVMDLRVLDMVLEAALRLEINLIIPGSFVDICNPDEEALVSTVCKRGLYVSQHHVEPVGVSHFAAENYLKVHAPGEPVSFCSNRLRMEEIWRFYIERWAKYGKQVVWQLGLRGKGDQAIWKADPSVPADAGTRGAIITDAIAAQHAMICKALGYADFPSTATLWNEGSQLYGDGFLTLPANTIAVFADFGISQMFGQDLYTTPALPGRQYGVYYHVAFWNLGPHLTEGCDPRKMAYCYLDAWKHDRLSYSILNVSNVRPVHMSVTLHAAVLQDPEAFCADGAVLDFHRAIFGDFAPQTACLQREYYQAFADFGKAPLRQAAQAWHFYYRDHKELPFVENIGTDGEIAWIGKCALRGWSGPGTPALTPELVDVLEASANRFDILYRKLEVLAPSLPREARGYLQRFLMYQTRHMYLLTRWAISCMGLTAQDTPAHKLQSYGTKACQYLQELLQARTVLEQGIWQHWHRGDKKINIPALLEATIQGYQSRLT